ARYRQRGSQSDWKFRMPLRPKHHQLAVVRSAFRRARGLRIGHIAYDYLRPLALGSHRRAADFKHSKQVHDVPPSWIALRIRRNAALSTCTAVWKRSWVSASNRPSRSRLTLFPSGRNASPWTWRTAGVKVAYSKPEPP